MDAGRFAGLRSQWSLAWCVVRNPQGPSPPPPPPPHPWSSGGFQEGEQWKEELGTWLRMMSAPQPRPRSCGSSVTGRTNWIQQLRPLKTSNRHLCYVRRAGVLLNTMTSTSVRLCFAVRRLKTLTCADV